MNLTDTHCHIHSKSYPIDADLVITNARNVGVNQLICVGENLEDSLVATQFVKDRSGTWASVGIHPHESKRYFNNQSLLSSFEHLLKQSKVVAIGECGLDYFYQHSDKVEQHKILEYQLELAQKNNLPLIFHVRDAFEDFWSIFDNFKNIRGVIHSFSTNIEVLDQILDRGLYVGLNGIMTFTKDNRQLEAAKAVPNDKLMLETDAPFLTPSPLRGTICEPKHVQLTAEFLASLRGENVDELANCSTVNANNLFKLTN